MVSYIIEVEEQVMPISPSARGTGRPYERSQSQFTSPPVLNQENIYVRSLKDDNVRLKADTKRLENEVEKLKVELASLKASRDTPFRGSPIKDPFAKKDIKNDMLREQEEELMRMEREVSHLKKALDDALGKGSQGDARVSALKAEVTKLTEENSSRYHEIASLKRKLEEALQENKVLKESLENTKVQVTEYERENSRWKDDVKAYMERKEREFNKEVDRLNGEFSAFSHKARDHSDQLLAALRSAEQRASLAEGELSALRVLSSPTRPRTSPPRPHVTVKDDLSTAVEKLKAEVTALHTRPSLHSAQDILTTYRANIERDSYL
eukprot:TRINITY_DN20755_c0_g1_i1.p2 TRINITY_DN20755_c0_g1~~TRINITY_DN20755_c0_g1_i1.p2  ORF type:complete len:324 (+),score=121.53 TRINITY_DN20755_c0_g1_i1:1914-2885(+)